MRIGFTGTRNGMSREQKKQFIKTIEQITVTEFHHGDCVGADADAHEICVAKGIPVIIWPPVKEDNRAFCKGAKEIKVPNSYMARNRDIVNSVQLMFGCPPTKEPLNHGGTWYTINYSFRTSKKIIVIYPDGSISAR